MGGSKRDPLCCHCYRPQSEHTGPFLTCPVRTYDVQPWLGDEPSDTEQEIA